jgi:hypothetical protein
MLRIKNVLRSLDLQSNKLILIILDSNAGPLSRLPWYHMVSFNLSSVRTPLVMSVHLMNPSFF